MMKTPAFLSPCDTADESVEMILDDCLRTKKYSTQNATKYTKCKQQISPTLKMLTGQYIKKIRP